MQMILFSGPQAAGKSSFFKTRFADTHVRINLDMLRTRHREALLIDACLAARQALVIDNTNLTMVDRAAYITKAKAAGFNVVGYRFNVAFEDALERNARREKPIPEKGIRSAFKHWQKPDWTEGFDALFDVRSENGEFIVEEIFHETREP